jgi:hypothetical protein
MQNMIRFMSLTKRDATHQQPICNETMNSHNNTPFGVPNSWVLSYKTTIHIHKDLTKQTMMRYIDNPLGRFRDISIHHHTLVINF